MAATRTQSQNERSQVVEYAGRGEIGATSTVLCVIQEQELADALREALASWDTTVVRSAYEALRAVREGAFDIYVVSFWLPDLAGTRLCREIRKEDPYAPLCVVSARQSHAERARALRAGADAVLHEKDVSAITETLRPLLWHAEDRNDRAMLDAARAIEAEMGRQSTFLAANHGESLSREASQRLVRTKALKAFVSAGGSLAEFNRRWPEAFGTAKAVPERSKTSTAPCGLAAGMND